MILNIQQSQQFSAAETTHVGFKSNMTSTKEIIIRTPPLKKPLPSEGLKWEIMEIVTCLRNCEIMEIRAPQAKNFRINAEFYKIEGGVFFEMRGGFFFQNPPQRVSNGENTPLRGGGSYYDLSGRARIVLEL